MTYEERRQLNDVNSIEENNEFERYTEIIIKILELADLNIKQIEKILNMTFEVAKIKSHIE